GEYFGVYAFAGKTSAIIGPVLFGMISSAAGSQRPAVLSVLVLFILGLAILSSVKAR
ncbi:MAG TPA: MFS transporter, partial [Nitrospirae bacterium]|nr:MFS transporter [Nitrospirota bacterium]